MNAIVPRSRPIALANLGKCTKAGRHLRRVRAKLNLHLDGNTSVIQRKLVDHADCLSWHINWCDIQENFGNPVSEINNKTYPKRMDIYFGFRRILSWI